MVQVCSTKIPSGFDVNGKNHSRVINFVDIFRPVYYFLRFCGQMPFSIVPSLHSGALLQPRVNKRDAIWFFISMCLYTAMAWRTFYKLTAKLDENKIVCVLFTGNSLLHVMTMVFGVVKLVMDMCNRYKLVRILNKFSQFDQEVRQLEKPFENHSIIEIGLLLSADIAHGCGFEL